MTDTNFDHPSLETRVVDALTIPSIERRNVMVAARPGPATHAGFYAETECLHAVELWQPANLPQESDKPLTVAFWNVERLPDIAKVGAFLNQANVDIALVCEVDAGMARSGQLHTIRETAARLGAGYAFGVEYVELGLGDDRERAAFVGQTNVAGLHGAGIVSRIRLERPAVMRLDSTGAWFDPEFGEPRVGGRIAVAAQMKLRGQSLTFVTVHLESHSDPNDRAESTLRLLALLDEYDSKAPVVIGGDFNTSTASRQEREDRKAWHATMEADPERVLKPEPHEPLFRHLAAGGFDWSDANVPRAPTERPRPHDRNDRPRGKIDWFFTRNISVSGARVVPAVTSDGSVIADHDMLLLRIP
jgi:endonuclease/exonuclease/phosphatase family metal-dependent hydrolase